MKRVKRELFHKKGNKVWLIKTGRSAGEVSVDPKDRKAFGFVAEDSSWPGLWTKVKVTNKKEWLEYEWRDREYSRWKAMGIKPGRIPWRNS